MHRAPQLQPDAAAERDLLVEPCLDTEPEMSNEPQMRIDPRIAIENVITNERQMISGVEHQLSLEASCHLTDPAINSGACEQPGPLTSPWSELFFS